MSTPRGRKSTGPRTGRPARTLAQTGRAKDPDPHPGFRSASAGPASRRSVSGPGSVTCEDLLAPTFHSLPSLPSGPGRPPPPLGALKAWWAGGPTSQGLWPEVGAGRCETPGEQRRDGGGLAQALPGGRGLDLPRALSLVTALPSLPTNEYSSRTHCQDPQGLWRTDESPRGTQPLSPQAPSRERTGGRRAQQCQLVECSHSLGVCGQGGR